MPFCSNCGTEVQGAFCGSCGSPVGGGSASPDPQPAAQFQSASGAPPFPENTAAAMCYLLGIVTGIIFLVWEPYVKNKKVRFHAYQSILLMAAWMVLNFALGIFMPVSVMFVLGWVIPMAGFGLWLFMLWKTYSGEQISLPVLGDLAARQAQT